MGLPIGVSAPGCVHRCVLALTWLWGCAGMGMCSSHTRAHVSSLIYMSVYPPQSMYNCLLSSVCVYNDLLSGLRVHAGTCTPTCIICLLCGVLHCCVQAYVRICAHLGIRVDTHEPLPVYISLCEYFHVPNQACALVHLTLDMHEWKHVLVQLCTYPSISGQDLPVHGQMCTFQLAEGQGRARGRREILHFW